MGTLCLAFPIIYDFFFFFFFDEGTKTDVQFVEVEHSSGTDTDTYFSGSRESVHYIISSTGWHYS